MQKRGKLWDSQTRVDRETLTITDAAIRYLAPRPRSFVAEGEGYLRINPHLEFLFIRDYCAMAVFFTCLVICSGALPMASALIADPDIRIARLNKSALKERYRNQLT
jgi:hypothetical protein